MPTAKKASTKKAPAKKPAAKNTVVKRAPALAKHEKAGRFHYSVTMHGMTVNGRTDSIAELVRSVAPVRLNTNLVLTFQLDGQEKVAEFVMNIPNARRLFVNTMAAALFEKRVRLALGDNV